MGLDILQEARRVVDGRARQDSVPKPQDGRAAERVAWVLCPLKIETEAANSGGQTCRHCVSLELYLV